MLKQKIKCLGLSLKTGFSRITMKSAYNVISIAKHRDEDQIWKIIWQSEGPQSYRTFLWLAMHDRLKVKTELLRRHILIGNGCDRCGYLVEDTLHVLRDYMVAKRLWNQFLPVAQHHQFFSLNLKEWICQNLLSKRLLGS